jgi:hypothetical protein
MNREQDQQMLLTIKNNNNALKRRLSTIIAAYMKALGMVNTYKTSFTKTFKVCTLEISAPVVEALK